MKKILFHLTNIVKITIKGFFFLLLLLSRGFFVYLEMLFKIIKKILPFQFLDKIIAHFKKREEQPEYFLVFVLFIFTFIAIYNIFFIVEQPLINHKTELKTKQNDDGNNNQEINIIEEGNNNNSSANSESQEVNPFRIYNQYSLDQVNFSSLKKVNSDTVVWLSVDYTTINYPIVQTNNNNFYLSHSFDKSYRNNGWTFMDFRNNPNMEDYNTIFYGHNLLNQTGFGSIANIFTKKWIKNSNKTIIVLTETTKYIYKVFSAYYSAADLYYLATEFNSIEEYETFLNTIKEKNIIDINETISPTDKIITLSTCTDDDQGRKVIHAKLISKIPRKI